MDVQVVAAAGAQPQQAPPAPAQPAQQTGSLPAAPQAQNGVLSQAPHVDDTGVLSPIVAKIFGGSDAPQPVSVNVSYRVERPDIIVTVFSDPKTGREIAQVPAEVVVQIAQFFGKESGVTLDRNA
jgi:hypothetical protein